MQTEKILLTFTGTKAELKNQLQRWCEEAEQSMNATIIGLVEKHLKENNKSV